MVSSNLPPNSPLTGEEPNLRALRTTRQEPKSPQPPTGVRVRWGRVFRELMYATGHWNRPDYTRALDIDIAAASIAREEEQERPAEATRREVESAAMHREVESTTPVLPEPRESPDLGSHVHDVGELAERLAEALGIEVTSSMKRLGGSTISLGIFRVLQTKRTVHSLLRRESARGPTQGRGLTPTCRVRPTGTV